MLTPLVEELRALLEPESSVLVHVLRESWLTSTQIERGLSGSASSLAEAGFFDAIKTIARKHAGGDKAPACPDGQKMVFGVCRVVGAKAVKSKNPKRGEDDGHMPPAWHRKKSEFHSKQSETHRGAAKQSWAASPRKAAWHMLRSIEHDVRRQHHDTAAEASPEDRMRAREANRAPAPL